MKLWLLIFNFLDFQAMLTKVHVLASCLSSQHKERPLYAFGSSTPRELEYLTQLTREQKVSFQIVENFCVILFTFVSKNFFRYMIAGLCIPVVFELHRLVLLAIQRLLHLTTLAVVSARQ